MAEYTNLQAAIDAQIRANGVQAITGPVLNAVLTAMKTVLGDGYRLQGVAAPADNPGAPDNRVAYLASKDGTYTNFGGLTLAGEVAVLCWDSAWTKQTLLTIDAAPAPGSPNPISSGAVDAAIAALASVYMALVPSAVEDNLASFDNAGQVKDSGIAAGDVVLNGGSYADLFSGFTANLVDTRSAGTPQSFIFRQSGGDGVNYLRRIKGATIVTDGVLKNNAATALVTRGFNQWDEEWESGTLAWATGMPTNDPNYIRAKNYIPALPNTAYYFSGGVTAYAYDENYTMLARIANDAVGEIATTPAGTAFLRFRSYNARTSYDGGICINISNASRNGTYEPYWTRTRQINLHDFNVEQGGVEQTVHGLNSAGTSPVVYDEILDGKKYICRVGTRPYQAGDENDPTLTTDGTNTNYPLTTPQEYNLVTPFAPYIEVDELGTEEATYPADTTPFAPFESDSNYSISVANLTRALRP